MGLLGTWGCRAGRHHAPWLPKCLSTGIFEAVSGHAVLGNSHVLVANAGLSGVTCALYPLERSLMLAPLVLTLSHISVPTVGHLQSGVQHCPWSAGTLSLRRWPETLSYLEVSLSQQKQVPRPSSPLLCYSHCPSQPQPSICPISLTLALC